MITPIVLLTFNNPSFFRLEEKTSSFIKYTLTAILIIAEVWITYKIIVCLNDFSTVRNNMFKEATRKVIKYKKNESEIGLQLNNHPVIEVLNSGDRLELLVDKGTELNKIYIFIYLEHTKIDAVKEGYVE